MVETAADLVIEKGVYFVWQSWAAFPAFRGLDDGAGESCTGRAAAFLYAGSKVFQEAHLVSESICYS